MACRLEVRVTPRSSRDRVDLDGFSIKVWTTAAPTDGQANEAVRRLLAKALGLAPSRLSLVRGDSSRSKVFEVEGLTMEEALGKLGKPA